MKKLLLLLFLLSNPILANGAELTASVCESGCDYTSLGAAASSEAQDLTDNGGDTFVIEISGTWASPRDTTRATIFSGWTLSSTNTLTIRAVGDSRASSKYDSTKYNLYNSAYYEHLVSANYVKWDGLQIVDNRDGTTGIKLTFAGTDMTNCMITNLQNPRQGHGLEVNNNWNGLIANNFIYNVNNCTVTYQYIGGSGTMANNTCVDGENNGFYVGYGPILKNNISNSDQNDYYCWNSCTINASSANNISKDTSSPNASYREITLTFADSANDDFHLASTDTEAIDAGVDLSAYFTTDFDGQIRTGTWDIGADEYISLATGAPPQILYYRLLQGEGY